MRIRDFLVMANNFGEKVMENLKIKFKPDGLPEVELSLKCLLELHGKSIFMSKLVARAFNERRIFWEDSKHELSFVLDAKQKEVCLEALENATRALDATLKDLQGADRAALELVDLFLALSSMVKTTRDRIAQIPSVDEYNAWVLEIGGDQSEKTSSAEQLEEYLEVIRDLRLRTYPLWSSLIDLLPDGEVAREARQKYADGLRSFQLDSSTVEPNWTSSP